MFNEKIEVEQGLKKKEGQNNTRRKKLLELKDKIGLSDDELRKLEEIGKKPFTKKEYDELQTLVSKFIRGYKNAYTRKTHKANRVKALYYQIKDLKAKGHSWSEILIFMRELLKVKVSQSYLLQVYRQVEFDLLKAKLMSISYMIVDGKSWDELYNDIKSALPEEIKDSQMLKKLYYALVEEEIEKHFKEIEKMKKLNKDWITILSSLKIYWIRRKEVEILDKAYNEVLKKKLKLQRANKIKKLKKLIDKHYEKIKQLKDAGKSLQDSLLALNIELPSEIDSETLNKIYNDVANEKTRKNKKNG